MSKNPASLSSLYGNIVLTLDEIDLNLDKAEKELKKMSRLRGLERLGVEKAQAEFDRFRTEYQELKEGLKESVVFMKKTEYEKSMFSQLETFATKWLTKLDQSLGSPGAKIQNNEVFRAVGGVIRGVCTEIMCSFKHTVATGKLLASVVELGAAIHDKVFNKDHEPEVLQPEAQTKSRGKPLDKLDESLDMVSKCIQDAQRDLQSISGPNQEEAGKALEMLQDFNTRFDGLKAGVMEKTAGVPEARDKFYKSTALGKMESFAKEWLDKITTSLGVDPKSAMPNSRISKAAINVVKCACDVAVCAVDKAIATGKVVASVVSLGVVVKNKVVGQTKTAQVRTI